jgi:hypothetical protein
VFSPNLGSQVSGRVQFVKFSRLPSWQEVIERRDDGRMTVRENGRLLIGSQPGSLERVSSLRPGPQAKRK